MKLKIILIDDDQHYPDKIRGLLKTWHVDYQIVSNPILLPANNTDTAKNEFCEQTISLVGQHNDENTQAILLDVFFGGENGTDGDTLGYDIGRILRIYFPQIPIILFTVFEKYQEALNAFNFDGYILKGDFNNWEDSTHFNSILFNAKLRRKRVLEECQELNSFIKAENEIENPVIIHISDIHRGLQDDEDNPDLYKSTLQSLIRDVEKYSTQNIPTPNLILVSGDITTKGSIEGYKTAKRFLQELGDTLNISNERIVLAPGNHDIDRFISRLSYKLDPYKAESDKEEALDKLPKEVLDEVPDERYILRFAAFKNFFDDFYNGRKVYNLEKNKMFSIFDYTSTLGIVIVSFNSCEKIDNFKGNLEKAFISLETIGHVKDEIKRLNLEKYIKIAVWHHPFLFEHIGNQKFHYSILDALSKLGFIIYLHGHAHEPDNRNPPKSSGTEVAQFGAGTIGITDRPNDVPRHYEILAFDYDKGSYTVYSRQRLGNDWTFCPSFTDKDTFTETIPDNLLESIKNI